MRRIFSFLGLILAVIIGLAVSAGTYVKLALPRVAPAPDLAVRRDSASVAHGKYLVNHVAACIDCHSTRDYTRRYGPMVAGTDGKGGEGFLREQGFPGNYYAPNITPAHLGTWTDGEIYQAITVGVSKDGHALFPVMPYPNYAQMDRRDIEDIIAYIRTLKPIANKVLTSQSDFPMNFIINTIPADAKGGTRPNPADSIEYGRYLTTFASCAECHTKKDDRGQPIAGQEFAGGNEFPMPTGIVRSCNITPAKSGIGAWTRAGFIAHFKQHADPSVAVPLAKGEVSSLMPWVFYANMSEQDLGAIYAYLRTIKPVENHIEWFTYQASTVARQ